MSEFEDHRWPVRVKNTATGAAWNSARLTRAWFQLPHRFHLFWALCMVMYTFIGWQVGSGVAGFTAWEVLFGLMWAAAWAYYARVFDVT